MKLTELTPTQREEKQERVKRYNHAWYLKHRASALAQRHEYYQLHKENEIQTHEAYRRKNLDKFRVYLARHRVKNKKRVVLHYSPEGKCVRCGFSDIRALTIDHINGGGRKHREFIRTTSGSTFYEWLIKNNFPDGFQILCSNCQLIKRFEKLEGVRHPEMVGERQL